MIDSVSTASTGTNGRIGPLRCRGIDVQFGGLSAIRQVDFQADPNEIVGLIGPNGAGKTTLVNVISGFQKPTNGEVWLGETRISDYPPHWVSQNGVVRSFQAVRLFEGLSVAENIEVGCVAKGASHAQAQSIARSIMTWFGLLDVAERTATDLPYGLERRVGIARAIAMKPGYLLLDEPAAGLTINEADELVHLIQDIQRKIGCGVVIIEHNIRLIMSLCTRIHVLARGETIAQGTPEEIRQNAEVNEAYMGQGN